MQNRVRWAAAATCFGLAVGIAAFVIPYSFPDDMSTKLQAALWVLCAALILLGIGIISLDTLRLSIKSVKRQKNQLVPIRAALKLIERHFASEWGREQFQNAHAALAAELLRLAASRKQITIEGHEDLKNLRNNLSMHAKPFSSLPLQISSDYWLSHKFKLEAILNQKTRMQVETEPEQKYGPGPNYGMLRVSEVDIKKRWPTPIFQETARKIAFWRKDESERSSA